MEETNICPYKSPLLQGDIIKFDKQNPQHPFDIAVIINADCDIENGKYDGVLALLPIYRFSDYLTNFWLPQFLNSQIKTTTQQIKSLCDIDETDINDLKRWIISSNNDYPFDSKNFTSLFELPTKKNNS
ncbi:hypothetical protein ACSVCE_14445 [Chromobacterium haemolyticum]|uniref:hypothetical protein n=1 Tax=Chromobacterium haemolyticum TaxID=394935 RepID=UPI0040553C7B